MRIGCSCLQTRSGIFQRLEGMKPAQGSPGLWLRLPYPHSSKCPWPLPPVPLPIWGLTASVASFPSNQGHAQLSPSLPERQGQGCSSYPPLLCPHSPCPPHTLAFRAGQSPGEAASPWPFRISLDLRDLILLWPSSLLSPLKSSGVTFLLTPSVPST